MMLLPPPQPLLLLLFWHHLSFLAKQIEKFLLLKPIQVKK
jgi:hypothetical protein